MNRRNRRDSNESRIPGVPEGVKSEDINRENDRQGRSRRRGAY